VHAATEVCGPSTGNSDKNDYLCAVDAANAGVPRVLIVFVVTHPCIATHDDAPAWRTSLRQMQTHLLQS
jgi:hypothetical protein